ncbi:hypothetical protein ACN4EG_26665 [Alkalinema pantanalense CENA528]|uniref:hypothetical protein n=1 Tax=Alkalinema pantanalense TaxID=1620705 RepID=UPI003D6F48B4
MPDRSFADLLYQVATQPSSGDRPAAQEVVQALLQAEKVTKQSRTLYPITDLVGKWRLCFVTGTKRVRRRAGIVLGPGFYLPKWVPAYLEFAPLSEPTHCATAPELAPNGPSTTVANLGQNLTIANQLQVGLVSLRLTGPARYLRKKNLLAFDFLHLQVQVLGQTLYNGKFPSPQRGKAFDELPIGQLPFFAFFAVTDRYIAARGRGGGLALWVRSVEPGG